MSDTRNFVILFNEKEGTSPLVRLLDHFDRVDIVHQEGDTGWEPFDRHRSGPMTNRDFARCLDLIFRPGPADMEAINRLYQQTAPAPLAPLAKRGAVGFKMRPNPADALPPAPFDQVAPLRKLYFLYRRQDYMRRLIELLARHQVTVLMAIRQDIFRWALSKYHGDGTGNKGHLQFKLAKGKISRDDLGKIEVDLDRFAGHLQACRDEMDRKRRLEHRLRQAGIKVYPVRYEDFCGDKLAYFTDFFAKIDLPMTEAEIRHALEQGAYYQKVHSDDISEFVHNHEELLAAYGDAFIPWADPA